MHKATPFSAESKVQVLPVEGTVVQELLRKLKNPYEPVTGEYFKMDNIR